MVDGFNGLRHDRVIRRDNQNRNIRRLCAAGTHRREGFVTGGIEERDIAAVHLDRVCADMLGDAARFARRDAAITDVVQQGRLAVVDVTHDGHDRRTRLEVLLAVVEVFGGQLILRGHFRLLFQRDIKIRADKRRGIEVNLAVDGRHVAQQEELLDNLRAGLADLFAQVAHDNRVAAHVGVFNLNRRHHLLCGRLFHAAALAAAHHVVIISAVTRIAAELLAVARHMLRVMLTDVVLLVRVVVGDALLAHCGRHIRHSRLRAIHAPASRTARAALRTRLEASAPLRTSALRTRHKRAVSTRTRLERAIAGAILLPLLRTRHKRTVSARTRLPLLRTRDKRTVPARTRLSLLRAIALRPLLSLRTGLLRPRRTDDIRCQSDRLGRQRLTRPGDNLTNRGLLGRFGLGLCLGFGLLLALGRFCLRFGLGFHLRSGLLLALGRFRLHFGLGFRLRSWLLLALGRFRLRFGLGFHLRRGLLLALERFRLHRRLGFCLRRGLLLALGRFRLRFLLRGRLSFLLFRPFRLFRLFRFLPRRIHCCLLIHVEHDIRLGVVRETLLLLGALFLLRFRIQ